MTRIGTCRELMSEFAEATGLVSRRNPRRYLWTDAFATCNFLGLHRQTGERRHLDLALELVDQVHHVLGRHREDDARRGWISGLGDDEGELHPTRGGLRIGKDLPERAPAAPYDAELEWHRDGQYFHYLTKWMHALKRVSEETGDSRFQAWAIELAQAAHAGFTRTSGTSEPKHMAWKMNVDLSRALVPSAGHHDPLDALITYLDLRATTGTAVLEREIGEVESTCQGVSWVTSDPLGVGGLLTDAWRLARMPPRVLAGRQSLLRSVLEDALSSIQLFERTGLLRAPRDRRLPFRELGLSIGLHAVERIPTRATLDAASRSTLEALAGWTSLVPVIEGAWADAGGRAVSTWIDHRDINAVMLATSLCPDGFLGDERP